MLTRNILSLDMLQFTIHPFSTAFFLVRVLDELVPIPGDFGQETGYTLAWLPANCMPQRETNHLHPVSLVFTWNMGRKGKYLEKTHTHCSPVL